MDEFEESTKVTPHYMWHCPDLGEPACLSNWMGFWGRYKSLPSNSTNCNVSFYHAVKCVSESTFSFYCISVFSKENRLNFSNRWIDNLSCQKHYESWNKIFHKCIQIFLKFSSVLLIYKGNVLWVLFMPNQLSTFSIFNKNIILILSCLII